MFGILLNTNSLGNNPPPNATLGFGTPLYKSLNK